MNYTIIKKLTSIENIMQLIPLSDFGKMKVQQDRQEIKNILSGVDSRLLMIIGPCSAWPKEAVLDYAKKLAALNEEVKHVLKLVMRVYIQKPRTTKGWSGPVNQPDPFGAPDIDAGLRYTRDMMIKVIEMGLPIADEALFIQNAKGFLELLSWVAVGARSAENQEHRVFASSVDCAVGLKNPTHGSLAVGVNSIVVAQHSHVTVFQGHEVKTHGNPYAHLVLRGGSAGPNYSITHLQEVKQYMDSHQVQNPAIIIDTSHDNCIFNGVKTPRLQTNIIFDILESVDAYPELKNVVKGFMMESFLKEGHQNIADKNSMTVDYDGLSITDPCLSWEQTEHMLIRLARMIKK